VVVFSYLRCSRDHVLDEIPVPWSVDDGHIEFGCFELPESNVDGDTTLTFGLQFVQNPGVLEGAFPHLLGFLLELLNRSLVNPSALVDQVAGGGRLARVDMSNDDNVNMSLLFTHGVGC